MYFWQNFPKIRKMSEKCRSTITFELLEEITKNITFDSVWRAKIAVSKGKKSGTPPEANFCLADCSVPKMAFSGNRVPIG